MFSVTQNATAAPVTYKFTGLIDTAEFTTTAVPNDPWIMLMTFDDSDLVISSNFGRLKDLCGLDGSIAGSVVPVSAAVWLFGSGLLGLVGVARRKKA